MNPAGGVLPTRIPRTLSYYNGDSLRVRGPGLVARAGATVDRSEGEKSDEPILRLLSDGGGCNDGRLGCARCGPAALGWVPN